jgi:hypothetical protein
LYDGKISENSEAFFTSLRQLIDTASYCKIKKGDRRAKKEYIPVIANFLQIDEKELLILWLADQLFTVIADEKELAGKALDIVKENLK